MASAPLSETSSLPSLTRAKTYDSYNYEDVKGWRRFRVLRPGRGMYHDVLRRLPYYWSDITDAFTYRTVASIVRMYFVKSVPTPISDFFLGYPFATSYLTFSQPASCTGVYHGHVSPDRRILWCKRSSFLICAGCYGLQHSGCPAAHDCRDYWIDIALQLHDLRYHHPL